MTIRLELHTIIKHSDILPGTAVVVVALHKEFRVYSICRCLIDFDRALLSMICTAQAYISLSTLICNTEYFKQRDIEEGECHIASIEDIEERRRRRIVILSPWRGSKGTDRGPQIQPSTEKRSI